MNRIGVFIEVRNQVIQPVSLELLSESHRLRGNHEFIITAVLLTHDLPKKELQRIHQTGTDEIILMNDSRFSDYDTHYFSQALSEVIKMYSFKAFLMGSTLIGRDLAPRISARVHTGLTADATKFEFDIQSDDFHLLATRPALGGNLFATIICPDYYPQMATIRPGVFPIHYEAKTKAEVMTLSVPHMTDSKIEILKKTPQKNKSVDLNKAKIIIAGGRGVATQFPLLKEIAVLSGGEVACSRAVVDRNITTKERMVGQTGQTVKPAVYLASGISGAIQHISGMDQSELIIAVNSDPNALIFDIADVSIIADANLVLPLLRDELKNVLV